MKINKKQEITIILNTQEDIDNMRLICALSYKAVTEYMKNTNDRDFVIGYENNRLGGNFKNVKEFITEIFEGTRNA